MTKNVENTIQFSEVRTLVTLFVVALCITVFAILASFVLSQNQLHFDREILLLFRESTNLSDPIGAKWVEELMRDITSLGGVGLLTFFTLTAFFYLQLIKRSRFAWYVLLAIILGTATSFALKYGFERPRPDLVPHGSHVYTHSFPSGHSLMSAMVYFTLAGLLSRTMKRKRIKTFFYAVATIITLSVGISRVYLGVHWPTDVLAGWSIGLAWAILALLMSLFLQQKGFFKPFLKLDTHSEVR
ncbi:phosphatase PAP2 family protein [Aestuariibacter sp. AA17]|uniref:undecaprenyl-diphosphate phosphatase n=1 Tax=Fluctibacter corallii TaxID=2984329 RepID=A0ABT3A580_9ALTE|nr:phosphatase PAP2 family protein [Aestuariibacter sp. AA17]MCV2883804.1 phosphatase PAP2 family protein [Aestuariibacter sp. AA17]